jgi:hypothetical protein
MVPAPQLLYSGRPGGHGRVGFPLLFDLQPAKRLLHSLPVSWVVVVMV